MSLKVFWRLLKSTFWRWWGDNTFRLGAALAYYTIFSLAPIVLIAITIAGLFFQQEAARAEIVQQISNTAGAQVGQAIGTTMQYSQEAGHSTLATVLGILVFVFGATTVFAELQDALNAIWGVKPKPGRAIFQAIKDRFWTFTVVLGIGFLLLVSLVFSAGLAAMSRLLSPTSLPGIYAWQGINILVSFGLVTLLFALIYKLLPDAHIEWRNVWIGAAFTALLFTAGKYLIGLYLGQSSWISGYGAAGSLIVVLLWVYYSSQIFLFGAEFTYVHAQYAGEPLVPKENAVPVTAEARARQGMTSAGYVPAHTAAEQSASSTT